MKNLQLKVIDTVCGYLVNALDKKITDRSDSHGWARLWLPVDWQVYEQIKLTLDTDGVIREIQKKSLTF